MEVKGNLQGRGPPGASRGILARMPWKPPKACRQCGISGEVTRISARGLCVGCGLDNVTMNNTQLHNHQGPAYNLYRKRVAQGMERYIERLRAQQSQFPPQ